MKRVVFFIQQNNDQEVLDKIKLRLMYESRFIQFAGNAIQLKTDSTEILECKEQKICL
jgi:hypothetical protein